LCAQQRHVTGRVNVRGYAQEEITPLAPNLSTAYNGLSHA
jgi:hypothetical protein